MAEYAFRVVDERRECMVALPDPDTMIVLRPSRRPRRSTVSPRPSARAYYQAYLKTKHWRHFRLFVLVRDGACVDCGSPKRLAVHHLTYERLGHERLGDLVTLCNGCHLGRHLAGAAPSPRERRRAIKRWVTRELGHTPPSDLEVIVRKLDRQWQLDHRAHTVNGSIEERLDRERVIPLSEVERMTGGRLVA